MVYSAAGPQGAQKPDMDRNLCWLLEQMVDLVETLRQQPGLPRITSLCGLYHPSTHHCHCTHSQYWWRHFLPAWILSSSMSLPNLHLSDVWDSAVLWKPWDRCIPCSGMCQCQHSHTLWCYTCVFLRQVEVLFRRCVQCCQLHWFVNICSRASTSLWNCVVEGGEGICRCGFWILTK